MELKKMKEYERFNVSEPFLSYGEKKGLDPPPPPPNRDRGFLLNVFICSDGERCILRSVKILHSGKIFKTEI